MATASPAPLLIGTPTIATDDEPLVGAVSLEADCAPGSPKATKEDQKATRQLTIAIVLCLLFMVCEVIGGIYSNSLAILTDAAHLLSDVAGLLISLFAVWASRRKPTAKATFGFGRAEVVGAMASVLLIWALTGVLLYEAVQRLRSHEKVKGKLMFIIASIGLVVNIAMMKVLHQAPGHGHSHGGHSHGGGGHSHGENMNVRAAFLHVLGDFVQSIGVMIAAALIWWKPSYWRADPICTFLFSIMVLFTTIQIMKDAVRVMFNQAPSHIDTQKLFDDLCHIPGVKECHDLHVWSYGTSKQVSMSLHMTVVPGATVLPAALATSKRYGIEHVTVQVEEQDSADADACAKNHSKCHQVYTKPSAYRSPSLVDRTSTSSDDLSGDCPSAQPMTYGSVNHGHSHGDGSGSGGGSGSGHGHSHGGHGHSH